MSHPLDWIDTELDRLTADHLRRSLADRAGLADVTIELDGKRCVQFAANDYLGLAGDRRLIEAAAAALPEYGCGATASPLICGHSTLHRQLEQRLANFEETEAAIVFPTGFAANMGTITALVGRRRHRFQRRQEPRQHHRRLSAVRRHDCDLPPCRCGSPGAAVGRCEPRGQTADRDRWPVQHGRRCGAAGRDRGAGRKHQAMLMVDEAHATGVLGATGRGACELCGIERRVDVRVGTLSKALGSLGGFVVGSQRLVDWLINRSRSYIFSTAAPPAALAAGLAALSIVESEPDGRDQLLQRATDVARAAASKLA